MVPLNQPSWSWALSDTIVDDPIEKILQFSIESFHKILKCDQAIDSKKIGVDYKLFIS